jgi:hypothetical protein
MDVQRATRAAKLAVPGQAIDPAIVGVGIRGRVLAQCHC